MSKAERRSAARLAAAQALYQMEVAEKSLPDILAEFEAHWIGQEVEGYNKFIPYYLFPESIYTVSVSTSTFRTKVSVGSNPWTKRRPDEMVNLATICERYGGGGHARVGAISFPPDRSDDAREAAATIVAELRAHERRLQ